MNVFPRECVFMKHIWYKECVWGGCMTTSRAMIRIYEITAPPLSGAVYKSILKAMVENGGKIERRCFDFGKFL